MDYVVNPEMYCNVLKNTGLEIISNVKNHELLKEHKINITYLQNQIMKGPIGLIYLPDFKFQNNYKFNRHKRYKITKDMVKTYQLHKNQKIVMKVLIKEFNDMYSKNLPIYLCLQADCGFGKTILACTFISKCEYNKCFVVTHNKFAAFQFQSKLKIFLPNLSSYVSEEGVSSLMKKINEEEIDHPDVLIFPSRHLSSTDFMSYLQKHYSLGIVDEAHINNFSNESALKMFYSDYIFPVVLSMTATPRLDNSLFIGKLVKASDHVKETVSFQKKFIAVISDKTLDNFQYSNLYITYKRANKTAKHVRKLQCLAEDTNRKNLILSHIVRHHQSSNSRIVVLVEFVSEAKYYSNCLQEKGIECLSRVSSQEVNDTVREYTKDKNKYIIIGTVDKLGTGFDLPSCNTIFLTSLYNTITDIQQYAGRCIRTYEPDNNTTRTFYAFFLRPHQDIFINRFYKNMTKALSEIGWRVIVRTIYESI